MVSEFILSNGIDMKEVERAAYRAQERDGVTEILLGILLLITGGTYRTGITSVIAIFFILWGRKLIDYIKERTTYPRIGYSKLPDEGSEIGKGILLYMALVLILFSIGIVLVYGELTYIYKWLPTFVGLIMLGAFTYMRGKTGDSIYLVYIAYSLLSGMVFSFYNFSEKLMGLTIYLVFLGISFMIIGGIRHVMFIRRYPVIARNGEE
jgi:hypothetical protein